MVIYHIHDHPEALPVQALHGLLQLPDADLAAGGIGGIGALRHIPVHGIIAPVKLCGISRFIHRAVIIDRHELDMGHAELLQIGKSRGMNAVSVKGSIPAAESPVLSSHLLRKASRRVPGKFLHMGFINHLLRPVLRRSILVPAIRVRPAKVHRHTALSVDSAGLCAYIRRYHDFAVDAEREIIIDSVEIFLRPVFPYAFFQTLHLINRKSVSFAPVPVKSDHDLFCKGTPDAENTFPENVFHVFIKKTKLSFVQIFPVEIRTAVNFFPFQCCFFHSAFLFVTNPFQEGKEAGYRPEVSA